MRIFQETGKKVRRRHCNEIRICVYWWKYFLDWDLLFIIELLQSARYFYPHRFSSSPGTGAVQQQPKVRGLHPQSLSNEQPCLGWRTKRTGQGSSIGARLTVLLTPKFSPHDGKSSFSNHYQWDFCHGSSFLIGDRFNHGN